MTTWTTGRTPAHRGAAFALLLSLLTASALPIAEAWHDHAPAHTSELHSEGDSCADAPPIGECPLLRAGTAPGLIVAASPPQFWITVARHEADASIDAVRARELTTATLPRAPPAV